MIEITNKLIRYFSSCNLEIVHFSLGPIAIINKKGIKNGIISLL